MRNVLTAGENSERVVDHFPVSRASRWKNNQGGPGGGNPFGGGGGFNPFGDGSFHFHSSGGGVYGTSCAKCRSRDELLYIVVFSGWLCAVIQMYASSQI